jgi:hypothetical protein
MEIISLGFGTITWFPSFAAHDSWSFDICGIISFGASDFKKLVQPKIFDPHLTHMIGSIFNPWPSLVQMKYISLGRHACD